MRRRLVISTIAIVLVVLLALAFPVGQVVYDSADRQLTSNLDQQADNFKRAYDDAVERDGTANAEVLDALLGDNFGYSITVPDGVTLGMPSSDSGATREVRRSGADGAIIDVYTDADPLGADFRRQLNVLLALALGALLAAAALAAVQARQLARPLERLATRAARIGDGDFSRQPLAVTKITEIDRIGSALEASSQRVDTLLANERHFTADATHQLRTGIAGIAMRLEILTMTTDAAVKSEAAAGLAQTDQLNATIDELLAAARNRTTNERTDFDLAVLANDHAQEWLPRFHSMRRHISVITSKPAPPVFGTKGLAGQVIDILIDNALRHGAGAVTLMIDGPSLVVIDQGPGVPAERLKTMFDGPVDAAARHGRGLPLARRLAHVDGATLEVVGNHPLRFRLQLVRADHAPTG